MNIKSPLTSTLNSLTAMGKSVSEESLKSTINNSSVLSSIRNNRIKCELLEYSVISGCGDEELESIILKSLNNLVAVEDSVDVVKVLNVFTRYKDSLFSIKSEIFFKLVENNTKGTIETWIRGN